MNFSHFTPLNLHLFQFKLTATVAEASMHYQCKSAHADNINVGNNPLNQETYNYETFPADKHRFFI